MNKSILWLKYLPTGWRSKIEHRPNLIKILGNTGWLFFDKIFRMGLGLLVIIWIARHLGPEQFGTLNYAQALVALFTTFATLGLNNIVVHDLVKNPENSNTTIGTAFILQTAGGGIAFILAIITTTQMRPNETTLLFAVTILSIALPIKSTEVIRYWFESRIQSKYTVIAENLAFAIFTIVKIALILNGASIILFTWAFLAETTLVAILFLVIYTKQKNSLRKWKYQYSRAKTLLNDSWPLILSGLAAMLYMRIDQIMLGQILGDKAVGVYSAAVRLSEMWYFIPTIIAASVFPSLIKTKQRNPLLYHQQLKKLFDAMTILSVALAIPISLTSNLIIKTLYGDEFSEAAQILVIHVWSCIFVFSGIISSRWFIAEKLQKYTFYRALAGCAVNIGLNFLLIPKYGIIGSAWSSVASQAVASVFFNATNKETRVIFYMQIKSIFLPYRFGNI